MHGDHMRGIRKRYRMTQLQFGRLLGFTGPDGSVARRVRRFENGETPLGDKVRIGGGALVALLELLDNRRLPPLPK